MKLKGREKKGKGMGREKKTYKHSNNGKEPANKIPGSKDKFKAATKNGADKNKYVQLFPILLQKKLFLRKTMTLIKILRNQH